MGWAGLGRVLPVFGQLSLTVELSLWSFATVSMRLMQVSPSQLALLLALKEGLARTMAWRGNSPPWLPPGTRQLGVVGQIVVIIFVY